MEGLLSILPFHIDLASSYPSSPGNSIVPRSSLPNLFIFISEFFETGISINLKKDKL
jgi:hypothetical protein